MLRPIYHILVGPLVRSFFCPFLCRALALAEFFAVLAFALCSLAFSLPLSRVAVLAG